MNLAEMKKFWLTINFLFIKVSIKFEEFNAHVRIDKHEL